MSNLNNPELQFAVQAVRQASRLVRQVQADMVSPALTKADLSPVTIADFASQALVAQLLAEAFPQDLLVGEEDAEALRQESGRADLEVVTRFVGVFEPQATPEAVCDWIDRGGADPTRRFWTLDPIDGTKGFLRGDQYAVALALIVDGQVQVGALGCPNLVDGYLPSMGGQGSLVFAERGHGAWTVPLEEPQGEPRRLHVSDRQNPSEARLLRSYESGHTNVSQIDIFAEALGVSAEAVRMDSQAKYAVLAAGGGEIYLRLLSPSKPDYLEKIWDQAAGSLLVEEAGGQVSDLQGRKLNFGAGRTLRENRGVLATNGILHPSSLEALRASQA